MTDLIPLFDAASNAAYRRNLIPGNLGIVTAGGVKLVHPKRPGYLYVRLGANGELGNTWAYNQGARVIAHLPVLLRKQPGGGYVIVDEDSARLPAYGGPSGVAKHNHREGSGLEYEVQSKLIDVGRVLWSSGLTVTIRPFHYRKSDGTHAYYPGGTLDLTSYVPATASTHAWVVVGVDPSDNTAKAAAGTAVGTGTALDTAGIDGILDNSYIPLAAIDVANGDTQLNRPADYVDARGWLNTGVDGSDYVRRDGTIPLSADWDIGEDRAIKAEYMQARDAEGLAIRTSAGTEEIVLDDSTGNTGFGGAPDATRKVHIKDTGQASMVMQTTDDTTASFAAAICATNGFDVIGQLIAHDTLRTVSRYGVTLGGWTELLTNGDGLAGLAIGTQNNTPVVVGTNNVERARFDGNGLGLGVTTLQGQLHAHNGTGGLLFVTKTGITGTIQTIIPDAAGDVTQALVGLYLIKAGALGDAGVLGPIGVGSNTNLTVGGNTYSVAVTAGGGVTVQRTVNGGDAGTLTALLLWQ